MPRPLMLTGIDDLEALFSKSKTDAEMLKQLERELQYRQMPRAIALLAEVQAAIYLKQPSASVPAPRKFAPSTPSRTADTVSAAIAPASLRQSQTSMSEMPAEYAYKLLKSAPGSTWESIEQTRRQLVQQSHPARLKSMTAERVKQVVEEAKRLNAAYLALSSARCGAK